MKTLILLLLSFATLPSLAGIVVLNGLSHTHQVSGGLLITGRIRVQNTGKKEARIVVYKEDMLVSCDKATDYSKTGSHDRSLNNWITANTEEKVLQNNETYDIIYTLSVPKELNGSYWSAMMIEGADPIKEEVEHGVKIDSKVRYAVLIIANSGNIQNPAINFEEMKLIPKENATQALNVKLRNTGIFIAPTKLSIEIYNDEGKKIKTVEAGSRRVYPEKCTDFELIIKDLPKGRYDGVIIADNGKDLFGANINLEIN